MDPSRNRPTVATLVTMFAMALLNAAVSLIPPSVPTEIVATGYTLVAGVVAIGVGKAAQGELLGGWLSESAPWSAEAHRQAVQDAQAVTATFRADTDA